MLNFFIGLYSKKQISETPGNFMCSYKTVRNFKEKINTNKQWIMDSGAFSEISINGKYTYTVTDYLNIIYKQEPTYFITMDYMCEPFILNKTNKSVIEHQQLTCENSIKIKNSYSGKSKFIGSIQGYTKDEYISHIDMLKTQGLIEEYMAVGSICRRKNVKEIFDILKNIKKNLPSWVKIHGLGVKKTLLSKYETYDYLNSCDSMAWSFSGRYVKTKVNNKCTLTNVECIHLTHKNCANCENYMKNWYNEIQDLINKYNNINLKKIEEFI